LELYKYIKRSNEPNIFSQYDNTTIFKENNNNIIYSSEPTDIIDKKFIQNNNNEECITFTAFNNQFGKAIIAWTTKDDNTSINILNLENEEKNIKINAHKCPIDNLIYFHNENLQKNNDFIISFSEKDEEIINIWTIKSDTNNLECSKKILKSKIKQNIGSFCIFNNANFNNQYSYLFIYSKTSNSPGGNNDIIYYKLDNSCNFEKIDGRINNNDKIKFLDTFYDKRNNTLYLLSSNNRQLNLIKNPFGQYMKNNFEHKNGSKYHIAFMSRINNKLELFISNGNDISIWDIENIYNHIKTINIKSNNNSFIYDMCLWNENYILVSTNIGFQIINLENQTTLCLDECKEKKFSKIRKIYLSLNFYSIVGIDSNNKLCLWSKKK
jgi:hypothetical protein